MNDLINTIKVHEGTNRFVYLDSKGFQTIGIGRCIDKRCDNGLSDDEINYLLTNDIKKCIDHLKDKTFFINQDEIRKEVLIELVFNMGLSHLEEFKNFLNAFENKHYNVAVIELSISLWAKEVHQKRVQNICYRITNGKYP
jgi:lysozyme